MECFCFLVFCLWVVEFLLCFFFLFCDVVVFCFCMIFVWWMVFLIVVNCFCNLFLSIWMWFCRSFEIFKDFLWKFKFFVVLVFLSYFKFENDIKYLDFWMLGSFKLFLFFFVCLLSLGNFEKFLFGFCWFGRWSLVFIWGRVELKLLVFV